MHLFVFCVAAEAAGGSWTVLSSQKVPWSRGSVAAHHEQPRTVGDNVCPFLSHSETHGHQTNTKGRTCVCCHVTHQSRSCTPELLPYIHHSHENPILCVWSDRKSTVDPGAGSWSHVSNRAGYPPPLQFLQSGNPPLNRVCRGRPMTPPKQHHICHVWVWVGGGGGHMRDGGAPFGGIYESTPHENKSTQRGIKFHGCRA